MTRPKLYPLTFEPVYKDKIWGGRKFESLFNRTLPEGKIGESWEVAAHPHGMSVVLQGELKGRSLQELMDTYGAELMGRTIKDGKFPLLLKFIDAAYDTAVHVAAKKSPSTWSSGRTIPANRAVAADAWILVSRQYLRPAKPSKPATTAQTMLKNSIISTPRQLRAG
jgi:mannose-6-phosphate isomerase class I